MNAEGAEKNLWDQIRAHAQLVTRMHQWGFTTLAGLQTALFFIRKDVGEMLVARELLAQSTPISELNLRLKIMAGAPLPLHHFMIGNVILFTVAVIFALMAGWVRKRLMFYAVALRELPLHYPEDNVKIYPEMPRETRISSYTRLVYFVFPVFDLLLYVYRLVIFHFDTLWAAVITACGQMVYDPSYWP